MLCCLPRKLLRLKEMKIDIQDSLIRAINTAVQDLGFEVSGSTQILLDAVCDNRFGDLSTNLAMRLAKPLKKPPIEVAREIAEKLTQDLNKGELKDYIAQIRAEGAGFINFYFDKRYFLRGISEILHSGIEALRYDAGDSRQVLIEFVSANPTGSLSVAHARQAAVGDCLANIMQFLGFRVQREYYLNDEGNQINILGSSVELRAKELAGEKHDFPENFYQGDYIYDLARQASGLKIQSRDLGDFAAARILETIKKELCDFGVRFDSWYSQKELARSGKIEEAFEYLKKRGLLYEKEGALWFKSTQFGDDKDRVVVKSDGALTYLAPDIAYHQDKFKRGFQRLINLWGPDHHGYISRINAAVQAFEHPSDALSVVIVQLATIYRAGKILHMSTRKGQYISLREVLDEVGKDAARFFFVMRRTSSHLDFDLEVAKKQTAENPVFYVQYAHARISNILNNNSSGLDKNADLSVLNEAEEIALMRKALAFPSTLHICLSTLDPYMLTVYLQELAEAFHKFYDLHRVLGQDAQLSNARLCLIYAVRQVLAAGLDLLGVSKPEKM